MFVSMFKTPMQRLALTAENEGEGGEGGGGGAPEPTIAELQAQMAQMKQQNETMAKEREQLLAMAAGVDKVVADRDRKRRAGRPIEEEVNLDDDEKELDPVVVKHTKRVAGGMRGELMGAIQGMQDQLDAMQFMSLANQMGVDAKTIGEVETQYRGMRDSGMAIVDGSGNRKALTRLDALDLHYGRAARSKQMKEAPELQFNSMRERMLGQAGMENAGGGAGHRRAVPGFDTKKLEALPDNKSRVDAMEKVLANVPLVWDNE